VLVLFVWCVCVLVVFSWCRWYCIIVCAAVGFIVISVGSMNMLVF